MKDLRRISLLLVPLLTAFFIVGQVAGQPGSNLRHRSFAISADSIVLDTTSIIPQTFVVENIPSSDYRLDFINAVLYWINKPAADSVKLSYRVFYYKLN